MEKIIRLIKLPPTIRGLTVTDPDGNYNIYLNCNLSHETQLETYNHETDHIDNNDFLSNEPVLVLENGATYSKHR